MIQLQDHPSELKSSGRLNTPTTRTCLWRDLYRLAIFERERTKIPGRIREAERALMHRERELGMNKQNSAERESVITALNCLHALRTCLKTA